MDSITFTETKKLDEDDVALFPIKNELEAIEFPTKCGEVFLQRRQQHELFVYFCSMCEENHSFFDIESFTKHITDEHVILESTDQPEDESANKELSQLKCEFIDILEKQELVDDQERLQQEPECLQGGDEEEAFAIMRTTSPSADSSSLISVLSFGDHSENDILISDLDCHHCSQHFLSSEKFRLHVCPKKKSSAKEKPFQCTKCSKCFKRKWNLKTHQFSHETIKPHACNNCSSTFSNKQNLVVHMRRHLGEKPFQCSLCEKTFVSSTELNLHQRSHTGERPYICEVCGKGHATSSQLLEHRKRHTNERRYACTGCEKRFRTRTHLRSHHMVVHANLPRSHRCTVSECTARFKTPIALQQHSKIHDKVKQYKCRICGKQFAQHPGLYAHMKTHAKKS